MSLKTGSAQGVVVVLVLVAGQDAEDAGADHLQEGVFGQLRIARVVEHRGQLSRQADAFVELAQRQQAGVGRERGVGRLDVDRQRREEIQVEQRSGRGRCHGGLPGVE